MVDEGTIWFGSNVEDVGVVAVVDYRNFVCRNVINSH